MLFDFNGKDPNLAAQRQQIKTWVLGLLPEPGRFTQILVSELDCSEPGCPPKETVIALISADAPPRQLKLFKALRDVTETDIVAALNSKTVCGNKSHALDNH